jgi:thiamine-monophosphate kinase
VAAPPGLGEFERIARFFAPLAGPGGLGLTDDVALIDGPGGQQYVLTTDAITEGVDYFADDPVAQIAQKLLRVNLSDLAAKGAVPFGYLLFTALPAAHDEAWLSAFTAGLAADQQEFGIALLGGDSAATPGPTTLSVTAIGLVSRGAALLRSGAKDGDRIYVSGTLGDSAFGLAARKGELPQLDPSSRDFLVDRYRLPQPRLALGRSLVGIADAAIDVSDGLVADLHHLCRSSMLGATIEYAKLPLSPAAKIALRAAPHLNQAVIGGGDDYEIVFTAPAALAAAVAAASSEAGVMVSEIGRMGAGEGVRVLDPKGAAMNVEVAGYRHF